MCVWGNYQGLRKDWRETEVTTHAFKIWGECYQILLMRMDPSQKQNKANQIQQCMGMRTYQKNNSNKYRKIADKIQLLRVLNQA